MHSLTLAPAPLHFVLPPTPMYPFFPSSLTLCLPFYTAEPRRRALRVYLVSFSDIFSQKAKYRATNQKCTPTNKHVDSPIQLNPGTEPSVYTLYPFQTFFSQKAKYRATNQKCTPAKTGWIRGTQQAQSACNPVLLPYHSAHWSFAGSHLATALAIRDNQRICECIDVR